jgi:hypothetical protein
MRSMSAADRDQRVDADCRRAGAVDRFAPPPIRTSSRPPASALIPIAESTPVPSIEQEITKLAAGTLGIAAPMPARLL